MIENQQNAGRHQHGKCGETHDGSDEPGPGTEREPHQRHALGAHVKRRRNEVQGAEQLPHAEDRNRSGPEDDPSALPGT